MQVGGLRIGARSYVQKIEQQEDAQKYEAGHRDHRVHWLVMQQMHEEQRHDDGLDGGYGKRDHNVDGARPKLNIGSAYGYPREDQQRQQSDDMVSRFRSRIGRVFGMRAHVIK